MAVIGVVALKGGVGKTTVSMLVAEVLASNGTETLLLDCDAQGSAVTWASLCETVHCTVERLTDLDAQIGKAEGHVVIDSPPGDPDLTQAIIERSDVCLLVARVAGGDLAQALSLAPLVEGKTAFYVLTQVVRGRAINPHFVEAVTATGVPLLETRIPMWSTIGDLQGIGETLPDTGRVNLAFNRLVTEIDERVQAA